MIVETQNGSKITGWIKDYYWQCDSVLKYGMKMNDLFNKKHKIL